MSSRHASTRDLFGLGHQGLEGFYRSIAEVEKAAATRDALRGQIHHIRRAFEVMALDGVLCVDDRPTVFFKNYREPLERAEANRRQRLCWNQGCASVLVLQDPQRVHLYSAMATPSPDCASGELSDHAAWVESLDRTADTLEAYRLAESLTTGHFYRRHWQKFDSRQAVDRQLVRYLGMVCDKLSDGSPEDLRRVHAFLGRVIFVCYLVDRGIIDLSEMHFIRRKGVRTIGDLLTGYPPAQAAGLLNQLFRSLRREFNGSLFEYDEDQDQDWLNEHRVQLLGRFLSAEELDTGQRTLGFWAYDFSAIPVETVSAVYEDFLKREDADEKESKGAFFTPRNLAEMTVDEALRGTETLLGKRFLDPACGSGIFLVILFNRIAEEWHIKHPRTTVAQRLEGLLDVMTSQLRGVDLNETACRIACFSLYVALLDQFEPRDLRRLKEDADCKRGNSLLPPILAYRKQRYENTAAPVVLEGDFFDPNLPLGEAYHVIVGNPPWASRQEHGMALTQWLRSSENPYVADFKERKVNFRSALFPAKQIAVPFLWKIGLHLRADGQAGVLLPSQVLLNQTDVFQAEWFRRFTAERVTHLADFRKFLFQDARRPCFILRFNAQPPQDSVRIEYFVPKVSRRDPRSGLISVSADDRIWINQAEVQEAAATRQAARLWKTRLWGTQRDLKLLDYLLSLPRLGDIAGAPDDAAKRFKAGKGFKPWYQASYEADPDGYGLAKPIPGELSDLCLDHLHQDYQLILVREDCVTLDQRLGRSGRKAEGLPSKKGFHRSPSKSLFQGPVVLISKGFKNVKVSFADFDLFFPDPVTGISGQEADSCRLAFLAVLIASRFSKYFFFHTGASQGIERDEVRVHEVMDLPFPAPEDMPDPEAARHTLQRIASLFAESREKIASLVAQADTEDFSLAAESSQKRRRSIVRRLQDETEPLIHQYFGLSEDETALIEDTVHILVPSATPSSPEVSLPTLDPPDLHDLEAYATTLGSTLNRWAKLDQQQTGAVRLFSAVHTRFAERGMCMVTLRLAEEEVPPKAAAGAPDEERALNRVAEATREQAGPFTWTRGIIHASPDAIRIVKTDLRGQWTRIAALNDADQIFGAIVSAGRRRAE